MRRSRDYCQGVQVHLPEKSSDKVFFVVFLVLNLFYRGCSMVISKENYYFLRFQRGSNFFKGWGGGGGGGGGVGVGGQLFLGGGGVQMLISIETHLTCDFPGGSGPPIHPSGSAHANSQLIFLISKGNISCGFPKDPSQ